MCERTCIQKTKSRKPVLRKAFVSAPVKIFSAFTFTAASMKMSPRRCAIKQKLSFVAIENMNETLRVELSDGYSYRDARKHLKAAKDGIEPQSSLNSVQSIKYK